MTTLWRVRFLAALFAAAQLVGCGGGGSGETAASAPAPAAGSSTPPASTPGSSQATAPAPLAANAVQVTVDQGPDPRNRAFNSPFVTVTVCVPGTSTCQTVDHVLVDTGSYGLRLAAKSLNAALALPAVAAPGGAPAAECGHFVDGYAWGAVRRADVKLASETASAVPVQVIDDPGAAYAAVPSACGASAQNFGSNLGFNGILGVGLFAEDCPACAASSAPSVYFSCGTNGCVSTAMPLSSQVKNPVSAFASQNSNGVILTLPPVPAGGVSTLTGSLVFGIGTQPNNQITSQTVFQTDSRGNIRTTYNGRTMTSFLDSGSNAFFFTDSSIAPCPDGQGFYCPPSPLTLSAVNTSTTGVSQTVNFTIESVSAIADSAVAGNVGGDAGLADTFDWGLPFFFGRSVYVAFTGARTPKGVGPYYAW